MADKRIRDFPTLGSVNDNDLVLVDSNNDTYNVRVSTFKAGVTEAATQAAADAAEALEKATAAVSTANSANTAAQAASRNATDAVNAAYEAQQNASYARSMANTANALSGLAQQAAYSARDLADRSYTIANAATNTANAAYANAENAKTIANGATSTANEALNTSQTALSTVEDVQSAVEAAQGAASRAEAAAETAQTSAGSAADSAADSAIASSEAKSASQSAEALATQANNNSISAVGSATSAYNLAVQAATMASNAENTTAEFQNSLNQLVAAVAALSDKIDSKVDDGYVADGVAYFLGNNEVLFDITGVGGGGGSGGGSGNNAILTVTNTSGWNSKTISQDGGCIVTFNWSSLENEIPTGNGSLQVSVSNNVKATMNIAQGDVTVDVAPYLNSGTNTVSLKVSDIYGNARTLKMTVDKVVLSLTSSFDATTAYTGAILFTYVPTGNVQKTVHFIIDGNQIGTVVTSISGRQQSYTIPQQSHGAHALRVYFDAEINGQTVRSNELYYDIICLEPLNMTPIISSSFRQTACDQYSSLNIDYTVYNPASITSLVTIYANDIVVGSARWVDRTTQVFTYRPNNAGELTIAIVTGTPGEVDYARKSWTIQVIETHIDVEAETEGLVLYLNAIGRSNGESTREDWHYEDISATLSGFNWRINGWLQDADGVNVLRLNDDARAVIPYKLFGTNFIQTGKTIEIEFATHDVANYNATIVSCMSDGIGLRITPQTVYFNGSQTSLSTLYKEDEHIRLSITVGKQSNYRLILIYINGIMSRAIQYANGEQFNQLTPADITIGSNDCGVDIYTIRVYDQDLGDKSILDNWIADTQVGTLLQDRYARNQVYSVSGDITIDSLPGDVPYMVIELPELPQYKGDKKTCSGRFVDPIDNNKSFTFTGCQINVQGTSSAIYYRKNWDMQFKNGFVMPSGSTMPTYALRTGSIPFDRFVLKADVASSESTNNTGLTMYYNDTCPYKVPEMLEDPRVRWGIEGRPIVLFWYNTDTGETEFLGKHNFNLPKRAPTPYGYTGNMESWEVERNNSDNVKFKDFDITSQTWDEVEQRYYPTWYDDFEARFPSDEWRNTDKLGEFAHWVISTDREQCTNENLTPHVTYVVPTLATVSAYGDDSSYTVTEITEAGVRTGYSIEFTKDTPAYRLTKFRAEAPDYMELESAEYYYLFTEQFLMIDSRAKNMFIGFRGSNTNDENRSMDRKVVFEPYDMDTAVGTNNSGVLMFGFSLEDTDTVSAVISGEGGSDAPVFNAQDSVLWVNMRDAFRSEITAMYRTLRASGGWSYAEIENRYEAHQATWSEAVFNEDARTKYLIPLYDPTESTDRYLTMLQGSKTEQRKWWLFNRFRYMDSKYNTGDASKTINMRLFNSGTLTITPAIDLYAGVRFGGGTTPQLQRTTANTPVQFTYVAPSVTEMETWIYSADMIVDVGDLSVFYPNELDFSKAIRLRRLKIGSSAVGYTNNNLKKLDVRNSVLLEHIDCRNCPRLDISVDLEGSPRLSEAYFDGTSITGVDLADGAPIETLHLPSTITALTLFNHNKLSDLTIGSMSHVTRLMLANMDTDVIDPITALESMPANSQVYIEGLYLECADAEEIDEFLDLLDTMRGVTRERGTDGEWLYHAYETAQVSGEIHTHYLTGAQIVAFKERYPYIDFTADHTVANLYYYTWDGSELLYTDTVEDGGDGEYVGDTPSRSPTAQYSYAFAGWSTVTDSYIASDTATKNVTADRNVYAAFSRTVRTYTVTFARSSADGGGTLQTVNNVPYGGTATYTGATPTTTQGSAEDYPFEGWNPSPTNITGNTTCYAVFGSPYEYAEITDSWEDIIAACQNGTYKKYKVGNYKPLDLGEQGVVNMQIVGRDVDELANDNGYAPLSWISIETLKTSHRFNPNRTYDTVTVQSYAKSGNIWVSENRCASNTHATATWTITATNNGLFTLRYRTNTNYTSSSYACIQTLSVNGTAIETRYYGVNWKTYDVEMLAGDVVTVYCDFFNNVVDANNYCQLDFTSTGEFSTTANIDDTTARTNYRYGCIGGWAGSELRTYMNDTIKPLIPTVVRNAVKEVTKFFRTAGTSIAYSFPPSMTQNTTADYIWVPSAKELNISGADGGPAYPMVYSDNNSRIKNRNTTGAAVAWITRSAYSDNAVWMVEDSGSYSTRSPATAYYIALGFCT